MNSSRVTGFRDQICNEYTNAFTRCCDDFLANGYEKCKEYAHTYIYVGCEPTEQDGNMLFPIRFPGATRGHIAIDKGCKIVGIEWYEPAFTKGIGCYSTDIRSISSEFIGRDGNDIYATYMMWRTTLKV